jgi:hypothetical protein
MSAFLFFLVLLILVNLSFSLLMIFLKDAPYTHYLLPEIKPIAYVFLPVKQGFNLYKNLFIAQIKQSQWFNDLVNFYNFLLRKYLPRIKSWFNLKK